VRLSVEVILLLTVGIVAYTILSTYEPLLLPYCTFYLLLTIACSFVIFLLEKSFPIDKPNYMIAQAAAYSFTAMSLIASVFTILSAYRTFAIVEEINALYFVLVALGEDLFTYGLPLALEKHTPLGKLVYPVFLGLFAILHYPSYGDVKLLLQPFLAACVNMYLVKKYRNVAGVVVGHMLTDIMLTSLTG